MGLLLKPQISEKEAAGIFLGRLSRDIHSGWSKIFEAIRPSFPTGIALVDNDQAAMEEFFLAVVAVHLESLDQVFDRERADRLRIYIGDLLSSPPFCRAGDANARDCQQATLREYRRAFGEAPRSRQSSGDAVAALLHERLGASYAGPDSARAPAQRDAKALSSILANFGVSWWRYLGHKYRISGPRRAWWSRARR